MRLERNGAPIPPEIAALMTQIKPPERLWQVIVERRVPMKPISVGPRTTNQGAVAALCEAINKAVLAGIEKDWTKAWLVELVPEPV